MDWMGIIGAHVMWKKRLGSLLDGSSEEQFDPNVVNLDNKCALGQWIYGEGQRYKDEEKFEEMRLLHAEFHKLAGDIVRMAHAGDLSGAAELLNGSYSRLSERLKHRILSLSNQVKSSSAGGA